MTDDAIAGPAADPTVDPETSKPARPGGISPRTRLTARIVLAVLVFGTLGVAASVAVDLFSVRQDLRDAQAAVREVRASLGDVELGASRSSLAEAEERIGNAERRSNRVTWTIASQMPIGGPTVQTTRQVVEVAAAAVDVASIAVRDGSELLAAGLELAVDDGRVDLTPLFAAQELVADLPVERIRTATDALREPPRAWVPDEVLEGRTVVLDLADETVELLILAESLTAALPGFLGADEPRRYFVAMQASAELRGTGGLIAYWGVLGADEGRVTFGQGESFDPFDTSEVPEGERRTQRIRSIGLSFENPPEVDPEFLGRYATAAAARSFPNINLDPDTPTVSRAMLELFELQTGERLDGVILLDQVSLELLLRATGNELTVSSPLLEEFGYTDGLPTGNFARFVTDEVYDILGFDRSEERNDLLRDLGDAALLQVVGGGWSGEAMIRAVATASAGRNLQVYSADEQVQAAFDAIDVTGSLHSSAEVDRFAVTANNVVGGKQDVHLGHAFAFDVQLSEPEVFDERRVAANRATTLSVTVDNPLPTEGRDLYIIGNCHIPGETRRCFEGEPGFNRTWFSLWAPPTSDVRSFTSDDGSTPGRFSGTFRDLRVIDHFHMTPPESSAGFATQLTGPVFLEREPNALLYRFEWWRQAKAIPDLLDVTVSPPAGWAIGDVEVVGGGSGRGFGVHGDGEELVAEVVDGVAQVRGTVSADTQVLVRLVDPEQRQAAP